MGDSGNVFNVQKGDLNRYEWRDPHDPFLVNGCDQAGSRLHTSPVTEDHHQCHLDRPS